MNVRTRHAAWLTAAALACAGALAPSLAAAGPAEKVYMPTVSYREWELEFRGGVQDWPGHDGDNAQQYVADIGYGIAPRWFTELAVSYSKEPGSAARVDEIEWENVFQLTEIGEHWMDVGLFAELARDREEGKNEVEFGPMFQKEFGRAQFNLNLLFKRELGSSGADADEEGDVEDEGGTEFEYAWQWKWRGNPRFEPGLQGFGSLGKFGSLRSEEAKLGPALFGRAALGNGRALKYDAALLVGTTRGTPDRTLRFQLEYEFF